MTPYCLGSGRHKNPARDRRLTIRRKYDEFRLFKFASCHLPHDALVQLNAFELAGTFVLALCARMWPMVEAVMSVVIQATLIQFLPQVTFDSRFSFRLSKYD